MEGLISDDGDATRNRDTSQSVTIVEGIIADDGDGEAFDGVGDLEHASRASVAIGDGYGRAANDGVGEVAEVCGLGGKNRPKKKGSEAQGNPNIAITKYFEDAIRSLTGYQELSNNFWVAYLRGTGAVEPGTLKNLTKDKEQFAKFLQGDKFRDIVSKNQYVDWFKIKTTVNTNNTQDIDPITKMASKTIV